VGRGALWCVLAIVVVGAVLFAREPLFFQRYFTALVVGPFNPPLWYYEPKERIGGGAGSPLPRATPEDAGIDREAFERAAQYAAPRNTHALLVARHGHLVFEHYWGGTDFDTLESAHSFNKTIVALAVGIALGEHRIRSIDEPAADYIREWDNDPRREITIRNLLQMSSGLAEPSFAFHPWSAAIRQSLGTDITAEYLKVPLAHRAGIDWAHQNVDPQMLALIVERATGKRYTQFLSERLWKPIGAGDAWLWLDHPGGTVHAECCLIMRQGDWLRIGELLLDDGVFEGTRVLPPGWVRTMLTPAKGNPNYGFQLWLGSPYVAERPYSFNRRQFANRAAEPYAADDVFFLDGFGKYRMWLVPSLGLAILRTGTNPRDQADWDDSRIPNLIIRGVRSEPKRPDPGAKPDLSKLVPGH
jgi:CubicO group peptidase (beta-lactamase class C family)